MVRNNVSQLLNIAFIISCVIHISFIFYNNSHPEVPDIILKNKHIKDVDMPISFLYCLTFNDENYKKAGYENRANFFTGKSIYNSSNIGWFGHMENGSTFNSFEGT